VRKWERKIGRKKEFRGELSLTLLKGNVESKGPGLFKGSSDQKGLEKGN